MFDLAVWKKTTKVIIQTIALAFIACVLVLLVTSFCQQRVYINTGIERNAYVEVFNYVLGGENNE
jgi:hypothetical protein